MTGTELRYLLGQYYAAQEEQNGVAPGLLATCYRRAIPVFVGAPGDGSVFLNSMKLWAMKQAGLIPDYAFDLDLHAEVFEACAYHRWGLFDHPAHALATLILGGGVPKNYNLQPEPALGQVLGLPERPRLPVRRADRHRAGDRWVALLLPAGRGGDLGQGGQGHLPADHREHAGGLLDGDAVPGQGAARQPQALRGHGSGGREEAVFAREPKARGYLRDRSGYRLFAQREELVRRLTNDVQSNRDWLLKSLEY